MYAPPVELKFGIAREPRGLVAARFAQACALLFGIRWIEQAGIGSTPRSCRVDRVVPQPVAVGPPLECIQKFLHRC